MQLTRMQKLSRGGRQRNYQETKSEELGALGGEGPEQLKDRKRGIRGQMETRRLHLLLVKRRVFK